MQILDNKTVVVMNAGELKTALEGDNGYTYIYFGQNITLQTGITIFRNKANVIIDGTYGGVRYQYEDVSNSDSGYTISVRNAGITSVTFQNVDVIGHNYYGIIYVPEDNSLRNVIVTYQNLTYKGPQITFHPTGLSKYIDCTITIMTSVSPSNEVAECNRIEIGGKTTIVHNSTGNSMFWFRGSTSPYFHILKEATVTITSTYRELFYGVTNLSFSVLENASFTLTSLWGMGYGSYSTNNVLLDKNSSTTITQTGRNGAYPTWYCNGPFVVNENASLHMYTAYTGGTTSNYSLYLLSSSASLTFQNPKEIVFYNAFANPIYANVQIPFSLTYSRINFWEKAASKDIAGSLLDLPTYSFYKEKDVSIVSGTMNATTTTITSHNYTAEETQKLPSLTLFQFQNKRELSIGKVLLNIGAITDKSLAIQGYSAPSADVQIGFLTMQDTVTADESGLFSLPLSETLAIGTPISFISNVKGSFLYTNKQVTIVYSGDLTFDEASAKIAFTLSPISTSPLLCPRATNLVLQVTDTRIESTNWTLSASINHALTSSQNNQLEEGIVFVMEDGTITPLSPTPLLIYQGTSNGGSAKVTTIEWAENRGILLQIKNSIENVEEYTATITWTLDT